MIVSVQYYFPFKAPSGLKENLNASNPSENPPSKGGKMAKRLLIGGNIDMKDKNTSWDSNGFVPQRS